MKNTDAVSIIVPTFNEVDNVMPLVSRIDDSFKKHGFEYEILFVDDHSHDGTQQKIHDMMDTYNVSLFHKKGERGKATSLLQGFGEAKYDTLCMIDADLQYPPEEIVPMYKMMSSKNADMVITERQEYGAGKIRLLSSKVFNFVFTRMLFGFNYDSQSGLKMFSKKVINSIEVKPTPWSFDLEFIVRALEKNYKILNHSIIFSERVAGEAKVRLLKVTYELIKASINLRFRSSPRKVKKGYQRNMEFTKKAQPGMSGIALLIGLAVSVIMMQPVSASAAPLEQERASASKFIESLFSPEPTNTVAVTTPTPATNTTTAPAATTPTATPTPAPAIQSQPQGTQPAASTQPTSRRTVATTAAATTPQNTDNTLSAQTTYPNYPKSDVAPYAAQASTKIEPTRINMFYAALSALLGLLVFIAIITSKTFKRLTSRRSKRYA